MRARVGLAATGPRGGIVPLAPITLIVAVSAAPASANSLRVTGDAGMAGTAHGLEITLLDPARTASNDAWAAVGPEKGLQQETALHGRFWIDLHRLFVRRGLDSGPVPFLALLEDPWTARGVLTLFATQAQDGSWYLGAWVFDESSGQTTVAGWGFLTPGSASSCHGPASAPCDELWRPSEPPPPVLVEFEWDAARDGDPGSLAVYRRSADGARREPVVVRSDLVNGSQSVSQLRVGIEAAIHPVGAHGVLRIDELAVYSGALPAVEQAP